MAEERVDSREGSWRRWLPWTEIFRAFWVALDVNNLLLAAGGILVMFFWWWFWSLVFTAGESPLPPDWGANSSNYKRADETNPNEAWLRFRKDRRAWNLMHEAAGINASARYEVADIAETLEEYELVKDIPAEVVGGGTQAVDAVAARLKAAGKEKEATRLHARAGRYARLGQPKPTGRLSVSPWSEDRGPNPFLLVTGQTGIPWEPGHAGEWFARDQVPVMLEPLIKLARPIVYLLSPRNTFLSRIYFLLVTLSTLVTWSIFGGAITRRVVLQLATGEKIFATEALGFTFRHLGAYLTAPLIPLAIVFAILIILFLFGVGHLIPFVGDIFIDGLFWPVPLILSLIMTVLLVGLVAWPLMAATVSADGSDGWEAFTRAYGCLFERPWHCAWYSLVAIVYGGVVIFFVGFMASMTVYLAKWGVNQTPAMVAESRDTSFLFVYAPKSFGWRELLLEGAQVRPTEDDKRKYKDTNLEALTGDEVVHPRDSLGARIGPVGGLSRYDRIDPEAYNGYLLTMRAWNTIGAWMVAFWVGLMFLLVLGFGYALFWTSTSIIYLLLRRGLDTSEMDDVYMEQEEFSSNRMAPIAPASATNPAAAAAPAKVGQALPMVEAPRPAPTPAPAPMPSPAPAPAPMPAAPMHTPLVTPAEPLPPAAPPTHPEEPPPLPPDV